MWGRHWSSFTGALHPHKSIGSDKWQQKETDTLHWGRKSREISTASVQKRERGRGRERRKEGRRRFRLCVAFACIAQACVTNRHTWNLLQKTPTTAHCKENMIFLYCSWGFLSHLCLYAVNVWQPGLGINYVNLEFVMETCLAWERCRTLCAKGAWKTGYPSAI